MIEQAEFIVICDECGTDERVEIPQPSFHDLERLVRLQLESFNWHCGGRTTGEWQCAECYDANIPMIFCRSCQAKIQPDGFGRLPGKCPQCFQPTAGTPASKPKPDDADDGFTGWTSLAIDDSSGSDAGDSGCDAGGDCGGGE